MSTQSLQILILAREYPIGQTRFHSLIRAYTSRIPSFELSVKYFFEKECPNENRSSQTSQYFFRILPIEIPITQKYPKQESYNWPFPCRPTCLLKVWDPKKVTCQKTLFAAPL